MKVIAALANSSTKRPRNRREYINSIHKAYGVAASEQVKQGLAALWKERKA